MDTSAEINLCWRISVKLKSLSVAVRPVPKKFSFTALALAFSLCSSFSALAQMPDGGGPEHGGPGESGGWGVGVFAISGQQSIKSLARDNIIFPMVTYENEYISWFGPNLDVKLPSYEISKDQQLEFKLSGGFDFGGYDDSEIKDTPILQGMDERKGGFEVGIQMDWKNPCVDVSTKWMTDVSGDREGNRVSLEFEKNWMFGQHIMISPHVGATWHDDNYVDFHYGVREYEARADRSAYVGEATVNIEYGIRAAYLIDQNSSVFVDFSITSLGNEIKDSPLVDNSAENNVMFFYMYNF